MFVSIKTHLSVHVDSFWNYCKKNLVVSSYKNHVSLDVAYVNDMNSILPLPNVMDVDELWEMDIGSCSLRFFPVEYVIAHGNNASVKWIYRVGFYYNFSLLKRWKHHLFCDFQSSSTTWSSHYFTLLVMINWLVFVKI